MSRRHTLSFNSNLLPIPLFIPNPFTHEILCSTEPFDGLEDRNHTPAIKCDYRVSLMFVATLGCSAHL